MTPTLFRDVTLSLKNSLCGMLITSHNQKVSIKQKPNAWYVSRFVILSKKNMVLYTPSARQSLRFHQCLQQEANYFSKTGKIPVSFRCSNQAGKNHPNSWSICFVSRPYETSGLSARTKSVCFREVPIVESWLTVSGGSTVIKNILLCKYVFRRGGGGGATLI